jgi:hypothetical protein
MDFTMDILSVICSIGYMVSEGVLLSGIFIIHPLNRFDDKMKIHASIMNECNFWCKNKYNDICYEVGWNVCGVISQCKHFHKKTIMPSFHNVTSNYYKPCVFLLKDGLEIANYNSWQQYEKAKDEDLAFISDYNSILYTQYDDTEDYKKNYTIIGDRNLKNPVSLLKHKSNVSFILFQLTTEGIKYDISLKEPMNLFVKDNTLNYSFFKWYMKRIYDVELNECFSVNYMTGDMSIANLNNPFFIKFNEDGVTSFSSGKPMESVVKFDDSSDDELDHEDDEDDEEEDDEDDEDDDEDEDDEDDEDDDEDDEDDELEDGEDESDIEECEREIYEGIDRSLLEYINKLLTDILNTENLKEHYE